MDKETTMPLNEDTLRILEDLKENPKGVKVSE